MNLKDKTYIKNRLGEICKVDTGDFNNRLSYDREEYKKREYPLKQIFLKEDGTFLPQKSHGYDIIEVLTKETNPELYL